jgi:cephalosporin hydroxylase/glycosyltransferase involved in cell wall biosynthesis
MTDRLFFDARLEIAELFAPMRACEVRHIVIRLTRYSAEAWPATGANVVRLSYHWLDAAGATVVHDGLRTPIPEELPEGQPVMLVMNVQTPASAGRFRLRLTLVQEAVAWFEDRGFEPLDLEVTVAEEDPSGTEERRLRQSAERYVRILQGRRRSRPYRSWKDYLRWSTLHREFHEPFGEGDLHVLATMAGHAGRLTRRYLGRPQVQTVSVIMPVWNRAGIVGEAIAFVLAQTFANWELIAVDDGSTDGTVATIEAFRDPRIRVLHTERNIGPSAARNLGLQQATGSVIAYLDSDNRWLPDYLLVMVNQLADAPDRHAAYCAQRLTERFRTEVVEGLRYGPFCRALLENKNYIDINAFVHDRLLLERVGGFDETLDHSEDWEFLLRCTVEAPPLAVPAALSHYRYDYALAPRSDTGDAAAADRRIQSLLRLRAFTLPITGKATAPPEARDREFFPAPPQGFSVKSPRVAASLRFVTVVVPSFEAAVYLDACLQALMAFTSPGGYEVVVVDNGSGAETRTVLERHLRSPAVRLVANTRNLGFTYAVNQGILAGRPGSDVVVLNNDALVTPGWMEALQEVVDAIPDAGIVVPRQVLLPGTDTMLLHVPGAHLGHELDVSLSDHHGNVLDPEADPDRGFVDLAFAPFFCVYLTRECIRRVGFLDEVNGPHYGSDRLYCDLARDQAGLRVVYTPHAKVYHFLQRSTADLLKQLPAASAQIFPGNRWVDEQLPDLSARLVSEEPASVMCLGRPRPGEGNFERFANLAPLTEEQARTVREFTRLFCDLWNHGRPGGRGTLSLGWLGTLAQKCPLDLWTYQEILVETRPDLIIETGTCEGGSALFLASICDLIGCGRVITIDIVDIPGRPQHPRISYLLGSSVDPAVVARVRNEAAGCHRVMVILDSDHRRDHVLAELHAYADLVTPGCYLVVEDSVVNGHPYLPDFGPGPWEAVEAFVNVRTDFVADRDRERFLMTLNPGGYLRRLPATGEAEARGRCLDALGRERLQRLARELIDLDGVAPDDGTKFPNHAELPRTTAERRALRIEGRDWPARALTMVGLVRLGQLVDAIETVVAEDIPGDVVEAGVWRGGACILARAALRALGVADRVVWCADSFAGLPPPDPTRYPADVGDTHHSIEYLRVGLAEVHAGFERFGELDDQVRFLPGWFADTLPEAPIRQIAVLRLDADMYGSTMDALQHLYPRVAPGGFVIVDDYGAVTGCRRAVDHFRKVHGITAPLQFIDWTGRFWRVPTRFTAAERRILSAALAAAPDNILDLWPGHERPESGRRCEEAREDLAVGDSHGARVRASTVLAEEPNSLEAHLVLAAVEFPGPDYLAVLRDIHAALTPRTYLELGVFKGESLSLVAPDCCAVGVDPRPVLDRPPPEHARLFMTTSSRFFADGEAERWLDGGVDLAFIDAAHTFESALLDFMCIERFARPGSVILLHDTLPLDERVAAPVRSTTFYCGDVWKVVAVLRELRSDLAVSTIPCAPSGLTVIGNLDPRSSVLWESYRECLARFGPMPFSYFAARREMLMAVCWGMAGADVAGEISGRG